MYRLSKLERKEVITATKTLKSVGIKTKWFGIFCKSLDMVLTECSKKWNNSDNDTKAKIELAILGNKS